MPDKKPDPFDLLNDPEILGEGVTPEAAIEFWKQRAKLSWEEAKGLSAGARARAFYVTGLYQQDLVNLVSDALQSALQNGETLADFKKRIAAAIQAQGWKGHRVENIFRTNMQSAYAAGRYRKMQAVKKTRPYWQYYAIMDKRTRPSHAVLNGLVYPADHEFWNSNYPPNGFRCRCGVVTLSGRQVASEGLTVQKEMPQPQVWTDPKTNMEYFVHFPGADNGFRNNPFAKWAENGGIDNLPGLTGFDQATPKKQAVTQKSLQADIESLDGQIAKAQTPQAKAQLEAKKEAKQEELKKKEAQAAKNKVYAANKKLKEKLTAFPVKTYSGIWKEDVTTADWPKKAAVIQNKKNYLKSKINNPALEAAKKAKYKQALLDLEEFSAQGQAYFNLQQELKKNQQGLLSSKKGATDSAKPAAKTVPTLDERKKATKWAGTKKEADNMLRARAGEVWIKATKEEQFAAWDYTRDSDPYNKPLRGYDRRTSKYLGYGKVSLDSMGKGEQIQHLTTLIDRSSYDRDIYLKRGITGIHGAAAFLQITVEQLTTWSADKLSKLLKDKVVTEDAFISCGSTKSTGFSGTILHIFCPKGTKMIYLEPISNFGGRSYAKGSWDGKSGQDSFGRELETLIQRGTKFKINNVTRNEGELVIDIEVIEQISIKKE